MPSKTSLLGILPFYGDFHIYNIMIPCYTKLKLRFQLAFVKCTGMVRTNLKLRLTTCFH